MIKSKKTTGAGRTQRCSYCQAHGHKKHKCPRKGKIECVAVIFYFNHFIKPFPFNVVTVGGNEGGAGGNGGTACASSGRAYGGNEGTAGGNKGTAAGSSGMADGGNEGGAGGNEGGAGGNGGTEGGNEGGPSGGRVEGPRGGREEEPRGGRARRGIVPPVSRRRPSERIIKAKLRKKVITKDGKCGSGDKPVSLE